jgi:outer membrane protein OmpA-like peptidoglycan-associated protein
MASGVQAIGGMGRSASIRGLVKSDTTRNQPGSSEIEITKQVDFEFDKAVIIPKSYPILDEVVKLLKANPEIKLVSVEGHTDNVGIAEYNERLSALRAEAVVQYLINRGGIAPKRLVSKGWGTRKPKATNDTDEGRAKNRRVEFHIVTQAIEGR